MTSKNFNKIYNDAKAAAKKTFYNLYFKEILAAGNGQADKSVESFENFQMPSHPKFYNLDKMEDTYSKDAKLEASLEELEAYTQANKNNRLTEEEFATIEKGFTFLMVSRARFSAFQ